jgi:hypothetical protein
MKLETINFRMDYFIRLNSVIAQMKDLMEWISRYELQRETAKEGLKHAISVEDRDRYLRNFMYNVVWLRRDRAELERLSFEEMMLNAQINNYIEHERRVFQDSWGFLVAK